MICMFVFYNFDISIFVYLYINLPGFYMFLAQTCRLALKKR